LNSKEQAASTEGQHQRLCVACSKPVDAERCGWCGVALAPGGFTVERILAQGPQGRVYRALDEAGHAVALKELQFAAVPDAAQIDAFEREAATLKTLSNPAIPRFIRISRRAAGSTCASISSRNLSMASRSLPGFVTVLCLSRSCSPWGDKSLKFWHTCTTDRRQ